MLRLVLAVALLYTVALSALASPLYLSVPSRYIMRAEDFKRHALESRYVNPPYGKDESTRALEIMLQGRVTHDEDDEAPSNPFRPIHVGNRTISMGPGPVKINHTRDLPLPGLLGKDGGPGKDGEASTGSAGSTSGGTVTNNGAVVSDSGAGEHPGLSGKSTV